MGKQIASLDRAVMNELYHREFCKLVGSKYVADWWKTVEAFEDHNEYMQALHKVLAEAPPWQDIEQGAAAAKKIIDVKGPTRREIDEEARKIAPVTDKAVKDFMEGTRMTMKQFRKDLQRLESKIIQVSCDVKIDQAQEAIDELEKEIMQEQQSWEVDVTYMAADDEPGNEIADYFRGCDSEVYQLDELLKDEYRG